MLYKNWSSSSTQSGFDSVVDKSRMPSYLVAI